MPVVPVNAIQPVRSAFERRFDALMAAARSGAPDAAASARRAAAEALDRDATLAEEALLLAVSLDPADGVSRLALAQLQGDRGDLVAARAGAARAFSRALDRSTQAIAAHALGEIARARGDLGEARDAFLAARKLQDDILAQEPDDYDALRHYARACQRLADLDAADDPDAARAAHLDAFRVLEALSMRDGALLDLAEDLAHACMRLARLSAAVTDFSAARRFAEARVGWAARLVEGERGVEAWREDLAGAWEQRADMEAAAGFAAPARAAAETAMRLRLGLAASAPNDARRRRALAAAWTRCATAASNAADHKTARRAAEQARKLREQDSLRKFALHHAMLLEGDIALRAEDLEGARAAFAQACLHAQPFAAVNARWLPMLAEVWERLGDVGERARRYESARDAYARARMLFRSAQIALAPAHDARLGLRIGEMALCLRDHAQARAAFEETCAARRVLAAEAPDDPMRQRGLAVALERLGLAAQAAGDSAAARTAWEEELSLAEDIRHAAPDDEHALRFLAVTHAHLASLKGRDAHQHRSAAHDLIAQLGQMGKMSETDIALRGNLWSDGAA